MKKKLNPSWYLLKQKSTGKLLIDHWDRSLVSQNDTEVVPDEGFYDRLTFIKYYFTSSGAAIQWKSETFSKSVVTSSLDLLMDIFSPKENAKIEFFDIKPLIIEGKFKFVKRGTEIRIIEDE